MIPLPKTLKELIDIGEDLRVTSRETKCKEFKRDYQKKQMAKYAKTLAAFSNTAGGVLIFGVTDSPRRIIGIDPTEFSEEAVWSDLLRKYFSPEIHFEIKLYCEQKHHIAAVAVAKGHRLPIICSNTATLQSEGKKSDEAILQQGAIYYRQSASTRPIQFTELQAILEERDEQRMQAFLQTIEIVNKIGAEKVGIVDVTKTGQQANSSSLYVSREVAKGLSFIDKGRFVETDEDGSPAYVVLGTVQLNEVVERLIEDEDKNLPQQAAKDLRKICEEVWGNRFKFGATHLAKLATALKMRNGQHGDDQNCLYDHKVKRWYYTRAGLTAMESAIRDNPLRTLRYCGPKAAIEALENEYNDANAPEMVVNEDSNLNHSE